MTGTLAIPQDLSSSDDNGPDVLEDEDVARLAATIDFYSPMSIHGFGSEVAERTAEYTDQILRHVRTAELDETGARLNEIVVAAQQFDLDSLDNATTRIPVLGGLLKRFSLTKEKALARFETIKGQVDKLVTQVESTANTLARRSSEYETMYEGVRREHALLGKHVQAIEMRLSDLDREIRESAGAAEDLDARERTAVLEASRQLLSKRADDMRMLQHSALQTLPMVRIIQANGLSLVDKFQTIRTLTLPTWKRTFMLALTLEEQKNAVDLASNIDDATNAMLRRNAELLHQNSVATAKANQRMVIDIDTLRDVHDKILQTLEDVKSVHEEGADERKRAIGELDRLRREMSEGVKAIGVKDDA
ncbi:MAG: tellurium resistance protein [Ahrensia sp.]|nr:tellurium resistance protein [Ahrensia sp.]|tara:strand:- start:9307 stop:10395 length:1089 start_codon:yes stop_codon:yes gene_type:complete